MISFFCAAFQLKHLPCRAQALSMPGLLALLQAAALLQPYISAGAQCTRPGEDVRLVQYSIKDGDRCEEPDDGFSRPSYYGTEGYNYCWHVRNLNEREPELKPNTGMLTIADTCSSNTDESRKSLVIGAPAPLDANDPSSILIVELRQDCSFFSTLVRERGGIRVGNESYDLQCVIIGDSSNPLQVTNSTSRLVLDFQPDFLVTPRGSLMTEHASKQAVLDGRALLSPAGSSPRIYSEAAALAGEVGAGARTLAFGLQPPTETYARRGLEAVFDAARQFDANCSLPGRRQLGEATNFSARLGAAPRTAAPERDPCELASRCEAGSCVKSLKLGVVLENSSYSSSSFPVRDLCGNATALWTSLGGVANVSTAVIAGRRDSRLEYVQASRDVDDAAYESSLASALAQLRDDGATVVLVCSPGAVEVPDIMRNLSYAPLATILTTSLYKSRYRTRMAEGWWEGEYFLETYPWDRALPGPKGAFTNLTSREYHDRFLLEFDTAPGRHSAITIAALSALAYAIEQTGSLNTSNVTEALLSSKLPEFFGNISFDAHGQQDAALAAFPVIQYLPFSTRKGVLDGVELPLADVVDYSGWGETIREVAFPMPTWELRECRRADPCGANGWCKQDGPGRAVCECEEGFESVDGGRCSEYLPSPPPSPPPPPKEEGINFPYYAIGIACVAFLLLFLSLWAVLRRKNAYQTQITFAEREFARWQVDPKARRRSNLSGRQLTSLVQRAGCCGGDALDEETLTRSRARVVAAPSVPHDVFHCFVSHAWASGQDQARSVKGQLQRYVQNIQVFLDVDNLEDISRLGEYVGNSSALVVFLSGSSSPLGQPQSDYFSSANCMVELRAAVDQDVPILLVLETDPTHGGVPLEVHREACPDELAAAVFRHPPIPWHRLRDFQTVSLRLLIERLLTAWRVPGADRAIFIPSDRLLRPTPRLVTKRPYHFYHSPHNPGVELIVDMLEQAAPRPRRLHPRPRCSPLASSPSPLTSSPSPLPPSPPSPSP